MNCYECSRSTSGQCWRHPTMWISNVSVANTWQVWPGVTMTINGRSVPVLVQT